MWFLIRSVGRLRQNHGVCSVRAVCWYLLWALMKKRLRHTVFAGRSFMLISNGARLQEIATLVDNGKLRVFIEKVFPLAEAKAAQDLSQTGHVQGKNNP